MLSQLMIYLDSVIERARIVIGGIEGGKMLENEYMCPPQRTDIADIDNDVAACVIPAPRRRSGNHCATVHLHWIPADNAGNRRVAGMPIYDITTICRVTPEAVRGTTCKRQSFVAGEIND